MAREKKTILPIGEPLVCVLLGGTGPRHGSAHEALIVGAARKRGWRLIDLSLFSEGELPPGLAPCGSIVGLPMNQSLSNYPLLQRPGNPIVRVGTSTGDVDVKTPAVLEDMHAAGRLAARHFAERGFRDVGFVDYEPLENFRRLYEAFAAHAGELGMACHVLALPKWNWQGGKEYSSEEKRQIRNRQILEWLRSVPKPLGVLTFSDEMAFRICTVCQLNGFSVPRDVAVLGHGNVVAVCECAPVRLSSIQVGGTRLAEAAVNMLQELMAGKPAPVSPLLIPPEDIVTRESTDVLATTDPAVARAVRYLWDHHRENVGVADVANAVSLSRRSLEYRFRKAIGRSVVDELRRRRLEESCRLLETTDTPIADIAPMVGFRSASYLHASFRRAYGTTPLAYRRAKAGQSPDPGRAQHARRFAQ